MINFFQAIVWLLDSIKDVLIERGYDLNTETQDFALDGVFWRQNIVEGVVTPPLRLLLLMLFGCFKFLRKIPNSASVHCCLSNPLSPSVIGGI